MCSRAIIPQRDTVRYLLSLSTLSLSHIRAEKRTLSAGCSLTAPWRRCGPLSLSSSWWRPSGRARLSSAGWRRLLGLRGCCCSCMTPKAAADALSGAAASSVSLSPLPAQSLVGRLLEPPRRGPASSLPAVLCGAAPPRQWCTATTAPWRFEPRSPSSCPRDFLFELACCCPARRRSAPGCRRPASSGAWRPPLPAVVHD